jgi:hypothetical protein
VLPHADLVVCLDGHGGIAAVCAPSELSAALKQSVNESAKKHNTHTSSISIHSVSSSSGTDSEVTYGTTVLTDRHNKNSQSHQNSHTNTRSDVAGEGKKLTRNESSGFFDLLSALPGMSGDAAPSPSPSLSSSPSSSLSSTLQADDSSSASLSDTDVSDGLDIFGENTDFRNKNADGVANEQKKDEKVKEKEKSKEKGVEKKKDMQSKMQDDIITLNTTEQKISILKNTDNSDKAEEREEDSVQHTAALLVEKETKSAGTIGIDVYWFYVKSGGGVVAVLLVAISNIFLPSAW